MYIETEKEEWDYKYDVDTHNVELLSRVHVSDKGVGYGVR